MTTSNRRANARSDRTCQARSLTSLARYKSMATIPKKTLQRQENRLTVTAPVWANTLLLATKWGWKPKRPSFHFLAQNFEVSESEAIALAQTIERIWDSASADPFGVKLDPPVDLALLMSIGSFCLGGAFIVR